MDPDGEGAKFRDYWQARAGKEGVKLDWQATWRNWVRRSIEEGRYTKKAGVGGKPLFLPNGKPNPEVWT